MDFCNSLELPQWGGSSGPQGSMFAMNEKNIAIFHLNNDVLTARTAGHILHGRVNEMRVFHKYVLTYMYEPW